MFHLSGTYADITNRNPRFVFHPAGLSPKLVLMAVLTLTAFLWESVALNGALALGVILAALAAGVSGRYIRRVLGLMAPFYVILLLTQGFWAGDMLRARTGQTVLTPLLTLTAHWWLIGGGQMSLEGVLYALNLIAKTLTMTLVIPLGVFTTDANAMIVGLVKARIPYKLAFIFSSTLRFFPLLFAEAQTILEAQRLRGLAFEDLGLLKRVSLYAKIAVPLILNALV
jgi:energy-coupling factor transport system permease protein